MLLIVFTIGVLVCFQNLDVVGNCFRYAFGMISPFILGGCLAFMLNIPMNFFERKLFVKVNGQYPSGLVNSASSPLREEPLCAGFARVKASPFWGGGRACEAGGAFPTFHIVFHMRVENSYFSTVYNRLYRGCKSRAANNI